MAGHYHKVSHWVRHLIQGQTHSPHATSKGYTPLQNISNICHVPLFYIFGFNLSEWNSSFLTLHACAAPPRHAKSNPESKIRGLFIFKLFPQLLLSVFKFVSAKTLVLFFLQRITETDLDSIINRPTQASQIICAIINISYSKYKIISKDHSCNKIF